MNDVPLLKRHRQHAQKSQQEVAEIVAKITNQSVNQSQISRWEDDPELIPAKMMRPIAQALGITVDELLAQPLDQDAMAVDAGDPYAQLQRNVGLLRASLEAAPKFAMPRGVPQAGEVEELCRFVSRKPTVVLAGKFDSGKSRLCNAILGLDKLHARYTPMTTAATWLRHIGDRPAWCADEVVIYRTGFDPLRHDDESHCKEFREASGGPDTLAEYATRRGAKADGIEYTAVVYLDAPVLRACNLVDTPGYGHDEQETRAAETALKHADVLLYLSSANGFIDQTDLVLLRARIRALPGFDADDIAPLANILVVASHMHSGITNEQAESILERGADTIFDELQETVFAERSQQHSCRQVERSDVQRRMFAFWFEEEHRREPLRRELANLLGGTLPRLWLARADAEVECFREKASGACDAHIEQYRKVIADIDKARKDHAALQVREADRRQTRESQKVAVRRQIDIDRRDAAEHARKVCLEVIDDEYVEKLIRRRYPDRNTAKRLALGAVVDVIESRVTMDCAERSKRINAEISQYLWAYGGTAKDVKLGESLPAVDIPFDARSVFLGGMLGAGTVGLLGAAGVLVAPTLVAVGLSALIGWGLSALFGDSWERRLARKVVESLKGRKVEDRFARVVEEHWKSAADEFEGHANQVEQEYRQRLLEFGQTINKNAQTNAELLELVAGLDKARRFFDGLLWRELSKNC